MFYWIIRNVNVTCNIKAVSSSSSELETALVICTIIIILYLYNEWLRIKMEDNLNKVYIYMYIYFCMSVYTPDILRPHYVMVNIQFVHYIMLFIVLHEVMNIEQAFHNVLLTCVVWRWILILLLSLLLIIMLKY